MKKVIVLSLIMAMVFMLSSCAESNEEPKVSSGKTSSNSVSSSAPVREEKSAGSEEISSLQDNPDTDTKKENNSGNLEVALATNDDLDAYPNYEEYTEEGIDQKIIITTDAVLVDFKFIEVSVKSETDDTLHETGVLYSVNEITPEKPFVASWMDIGLLPQRAISYTDSTGMVKNYAISTSGEDGSIILIEF